MTVDAFSHARAKIDALLAAERADERLAPNTLTRAFVHDAPAERAIVLLHGFTNSPAQFAELGRRLFESGDNVYIPRMPEHGYRDRLTYALERLTAEQLLAATVEATLIAAGLGRRVQIAGLSLGGLLAAWAGQELDVASITAIAPFLAIGSLPLGMNLALSYALRAFPDFYVWWDPRLKAGNPQTPHHAYPGFPSHSLAPQFTIGRRLSHASHHRAPRSLQLQLVMNANDHVVNNAVAVALFERWAGRAARTLVYEFPDLPKTHDIIDPAHHALPIDRIYGKLIELFHLA